MRYRGEFATSSDYVAFVRAVASLQLKMTVALVLMAIWAGCSVFLGFFGFVFIWWVAKLGRILGMPRWGVVLMSIGMIVPLVNMIILGVINLKSCHVLSDAGVHVGILGASRLDLEQFENRMQYEQW
jgi:hypothetical protein